MFSINYKLPEGVKPDGELTKGQIVHITEVESILFVPERLLKRREAFPNASVVIFNLSNMTESAQDDFRKDPAELGQAYPVNWADRVSTYLDMKFDEVDESEIDNPDDMLDTAMRIIKDSLLVDPLISASLYFEDNSVYVTQIKDEYVQMLRVFQRVYNLAKEGTYGLDK